VRRIAPWLVSIAAILFGTLALNGYYHNRAEISVLRNEVEEASERTHKLQSQLTLAEIARDDAERLIRETKGEHQPTPSSTQSHRLVANNEEMRKDPRYVSLWREIERRTIKRLDGPIVARMNLQPDQEAALYDLLVERVESSLDGNQAAQQANLPVKDCEAAQQAAWNAVGEQIAALIGQQNFDTLQGQVAMYYWSVANSIAVDFTLAGSPLTPDQEYSLAQSYKAAHLQPGLAFVDPNNQTPDPQSGFTPDYQAFFDSAAPILNPVQQAIFREELLERVEFQQYSQEMAARAH